MGPLVRICWMALVVGGALARPSAEISERDSRGQTISDTSDPSEARGLTETLAYYGGAKGQYLVIHPSGRRTVSRTPPPLKGSPTKPPKEEEDVGMAEEEEEEGDNESVAINPPPENASVAEAKPVGLAIAGMGGVASSSPVAQAIVGPGGLAVARPVATAIAGVKGGGVPGAVAVSGKDEEATSRRLQHQQIFFDPETNRLHAVPNAGHRYLYPVNLY